MPPNNVHSGELSVVGAKCPYAKPRERAVRESDALNSLYKEHVHGLSSGRCELLRALCAHLQRSTLVLQVQELELGASQMHISPPQEVPVDTDALPMMSAAQLGQFLDMEALKVLHSTLAT
jgi:hypothetical protein